MAKDKKQKSISVSPASSRPKIDWKGRAKTRNANRHQKRTAVFKARRKEFLEKLKALIPVSQVLPVAPGGLNRAEYKRAVRRHLERAA